MIGFLKGVVHSKEGGKLLIDVRGVGYELFMPERDLRQIPPPGQEAFVHVHTAFRDDAISLFGFTSPERRQLFRLLLDVSGVGPKLAMNVLGNISAHDLLGVLARGETAALQTIQGVGKKTAARLCVDLKDRAAKVLMESGLESCASSRVSGQTSEAGDSLVSDAISALVNLGWRLSEVERAVEAVLDDASPGSVDLQQVITGAMARLSTLQRSLG